MKKIIIFCWSVSLIILSGCHEPSPVELTDDRDDSGLIEMKSIGYGSDSLFIQSGVDSTGLYGGTNSRYFAKMLFTGIRYDMASVSDSLVQAEAIFLDKSDPVQYNGNTMAYPSVDVGNLTVNGMTLQKLERRFRMPVSARDTAIGFYYRLRMQYDYAGGQIYHWLGSGYSGIGPFDVPFTAQTEIQVKEIVPYYVRVDEQMHIKWRCGNPFVNLIISRPGELQQRSWVPVLHLRIRNLKGEVTIPSKVLGILPVKRYQNFLFTFISDSRSEVNIGGYPDPVLIQSASVHNILLDVQR